LEGRLFSVSEELEELAVKYAREAIAMDRKGAREEAILNYERAVEILQKLYDLYPNSPQSRIYLQRIKAYRDRISELEVREDPRADPAQRGREFEVNVLPERPSVRWSDIAGLEEAKRAIEEAIVFPAKRPDLFPLGWPRGILLFGPPGCGKTLLAAAMANEIDAHFICEDAATLMSKWLGESEKNVAKLFERARGLSNSGRPVIIFIDEIDSIAGVRLDEVGGEVRMRNQFLKEMDGVIDKSKNHRIYVVGATNKPWDLDEPFIRRFQKRIYVPLPDREARLGILKILVKDLKLDGDVDLQRLADLLEGYSGSDIKDLIQTAHMKVIREFFESGGSAPRPINMEDICEAIRRRKPSVPRDLIKLYEKWSERFSAL
jgi:SpoVK/Ycf46/Vps4 family AAA+-type ATPase